MNKTFIVAATTLSLLFGSASAMAETVCTDVTITGAYAAHGQGSIEREGATVPEAIVAIHTFDGKGGYSGYGHQTIAGVPRAFRTTGTYKVEPNCVITLEGTATPSVSTVVHWFGVIADGGNSIFATRTDAGATTATAFNRIIPVK